MQTPFLRDRGNLNFEIFNDRDWETNFWLRETKMEGEICSCGKWGKAIDCFEKHLAQREIQIKYYGTKCTKFYKFFHILYLLISLLWLDCIWRKRLGWFYNNYVDKIFCSWIGRNRKESIFPEILGHPPYSLQLDMRLSD